MTKGRLLIILFATFIACLRGSDVPTESSLTESFTSAPTQSVTEGPENSERTSETYQSSPKPEPSQMYPKSFRPDQSSQHPSPINNEETTLIENVTIPQLNYQENNYHISTSWIRTFPVYFMFILCGILLLLGIGLVCVAIYGVTMLSYSDEESPRPRIAKMSDIPAHRDPEILRYNSVYEAPPVYYRAPFPMHFGSNTNAARFSVQSLHAASM